MNIKEMIEKNLIRKETIKQEELFNSLEIAERFLERAKGNLKIEFWDVAFTLAYDAMFHAARTLLFKLGYKERSHYAMIYVLKENYKKDKILQNFLESLDSYRISRHGIKYSGSFCSEIDAKEALKDAENFLIYVRGIIKRG